MSAVPAAGREVTRITTTRSLQQIFKSGLTPDDLAGIIATARVETVRAGEAVIREGETGDDIFIIRSGSIVVEKLIAGKPVFLNYVPAGSYVGEMAVIDGGPRTATVRAAVKADVIRLEGAAFRALLERKPRNCLPGYAPTWRGAPASTTSSNRKRTVSAGSWTCTPASSISSSTRASARRPTCF